MHRNMAFADGSKRNIVNTGGIMYFTANGNCTNAHMLGGKKLVITKNIGEVARSLQRNKAFFRIHNSHIVNMDYVTAVEGGHTCYFFEGTELPVARNRQKHFRRALLNHKPYHRLLRLYLSHNQHNQSGPSLPPPDILD